jgi:flagellar export protein FliJ
VSFRFPLQPVLRLRKSLEHLERQRLEIVTHQLAKLREESERLKKEQGAAAERLAKAMERGLTSVELHYELACSQARERRQIALAKGIAALVQQRQSQIVAFRHARQQRQILDNLRNRQLEIYEQLEARREQQQLDDLFLIRLQTEQRR